MSSWNYELSIVQTLTVPSSFPLRERTFNRYQESRKQSAYPKCPSRISPLRQSTRSEDEFVLIALAIIHQIPYQPYPSNLLRRQQSSRREPYSFVRPNRSNWDRRSSLSLPLSILIQLSHLRRPQPPDTRRAQQIHATDKDLCRKVSRRRNQLQSNALSERGRQHERKADHAKSKRQPLHADDVGCHGYHGGPEGAGHCATRESKNYEHGVGFGWHPYGETKYPAERRGENRYVDTTENV
jgi:hypothetical protein